MVQVAEQPYVFDSADILRRLVNADDETLPKELAEYILKLNFSPIDHARVELLSEKAQAGSLTEREGVDLDNLIHMGSWLAVLQIKARQSLGLE